MATTKEAVAKFSELEKKAHQALLVMSPHYEAISDDPIILRIIWINGYLHAKSGNSKLSDNYKILIDKKIKNASNKKV